MRARLFEEVEASANYYTTRGKSIVPIDSCCQVLPKTSQPSLPSLEVEGGGGREIPPKALPCQWCWMVLKLTFMAHLHANIDMKYKVSVKHQSSSRSSTDFETFSHLFHIFSCGVLNTVQEEGCIHQSQLRIISVTSEANFPLSKSQDVWWKRAWRSLQKAKLYCIQRNIFWYSTTISFLLWIVESYFYGRTFFDLGSSGYEGVVKHR